MVKKSLISIIKNMLSVMGLIVLTVFGIYDENDANFIFKVMVILSPLLFSDLVINRRVYDKKMRNDIKSQFIKSIMTYEVFEKFAIVFLLFVNVAMLTGIAYAFFGFSNISFLYILTFYVLFVPLSAKVIQKY